MGPPRGPILCHDWGVSDLPRTSSRRAARLAGLPLGIAGRAAGSLGRRAFGVAATTRASLAVYNTPAEIDARFSPVSVPGTWWIAPQP